MSRLTLLALALFAPLALGCAPGLDDGCAPGDRHLALEMGGRGCLRSSAGQACELDVTGQFPLCCPTVIDGETVDTCCSRQQAFGNLSNHTCGQVQITATFFSRPHPGFGQLDLFFSGVQRRIEPRGAVEAALSGTASALSEASAELVIGYALLDERGERVLEDQYLVELFHDEVMFDDGLPPPFPPPPENDDAGSPEPDGG